MTIILGLLSLAILTGLVLGIIALIRPLPSLGLQNKRRAGLLLAASIVATAAFGALAPPAETTSEANSTTALNKSAKRSSEKVEPVEADHTAGVVALFEQVQSQAVPCNEVGEAVAKMAKAPSSAQDMYDLLRQAENVCKETSFNLRSLDTPASLNRKQRKAFREALADCGSAYRLKAGVYGDYATALDKGASLSKRAELRSYASDTVFAEPNCRAKYLVAAKLSGVDTPTLSEK